MDHSLQNIIQEQQNNHETLEKLFRYSGLIESIDFFSQQMNSEQIIDAVFDFINELLLVEHSALYYLSEDNKSYIRKKVKGKFGKPEVITAEETHDNYAKFHGSILYDKKDMVKYFKEDLTQQYNVKLVIPIIAEYSLSGFIFITNKTMGDFTENDYIIAEVLMKLCNTALGNYKSYQVLQKANLSLDEKIFNLFAINQSSRVLLSELDLAALYNLSTDVFSELTQSSVTGFVLYDEKSETYTLKAFKDIFHNVKDIWISLSLKSGSVIDSNKIIIDVSKEGDRAYFNSIFEENIDSLSELKPLYLILIVRNNQILGFVSLSSTVTGAKYKSSIFELIESLASSTFISLSNARLFSQVTEQKKSIQRKLEKLVSLNELIKNINSSTRTDILLEMTLKTLNISFDVEKALIALYDKEKGEFKIQSLYGISVPEVIIKPDSRWEKVLEGDTLIISSEEETKEFLEEDFYNSLGEISGLSIMPIYIERIDTDLLGVIMVFKYKEAGNGEEENILTLESIAGHIAPVLNNLYTLEEQQKFLLPNHIELFKKALKNEIMQAEEFSMELEVLEIMDCRDFLFKEETLADKLKNYFTRIYPFSYNNIFILDNEITEDVDNFIKEITGIDNLKVKQMVYNKHFKNFGEFFQLF